MTMELQKINVKFFFADASPIQAESFVEIFNSWIQNSDGEYYDLADYAHVPAGPGVLLVAHEANLSIDNTGNRWGLLYSRKQPVQGSNREKLQSAFATALEYCRRIEMEPALQGRLRFRGDEALIIVNDRLLAPNSPQTFSSLQPPLKRLLNHLYPGADLHLEHCLHAQRLFEVQIRTSANPPIAELLQRLLD